MPTQNDHIEHCNHCQHNANFLASFLLEHSNDWSITVMFYIAVHAMEAILSNNGINCQSHQSRKNELEKLDIEGLNTALCLYKNLERKAHDSRYKNYKIYDWEVHRVYKEILQKIIIWFNSQKIGKEIQLERCSQMDDKWFQKYKAKDSECYKCH